MSLSFQVDKIKSPPLAAKEARDVQHRPNHANNPNRLNLLGEDVTTSA
nr:MAG TPA: hypothetical protein [Caudoviricetes sp.]